ncbi:MAG: FAD-dependent monooxygenase [Bacteroidota bacterium]
MKEELKCTIIGGGIAGLTFANACQQHNIPFTIYEKMPNTKPKGLGIWLGVNAVSSLSKIGISTKRLEEKGAVLNQLLLLNSKEQHITKFNLKKYAEKFGYPAISILRSDLKEILVENIDSEKIIYDKTVTDIQYREDQQVVEFSDGTEIFSKLIVGADGIKSTCRKILFPNVSYKRRKRICFRGVSAFTDIPEIYKNSGVEFWGQGSIFGFSPLPDNQLFWWAVISQNEDSPHLESDIQKQAILDENYAEYPEFVRTIIRHTDMHHLSTSKILSLPYLNKWHNGKAVLIGDAAHGMEPNLGQGGSMAIENAIILANGLKTGKILISQLSRYRKMTYFKVYLIKYISQVLGAVSIVKNKAISQFINTILKYTPTIFKTIVLNYIYNSKVK